MNTWIGQDVVVVLGYEPVADKGAVCPVTPGCSAASSQWAEPTAPAKVLVTLIVTKPAETPERSLLLSQNMQTGLQAQEHVVRAVPGDELPCHR